MRPFEIILFLILALFCAQPFIKQLKERPWSWILPFLVVMAALVQVMLELPRWQLIPAYGIAAAAAGMVVWRLKIPPAGGKQLRAGKIVLVVLGWVGLVLSVLLAWALPIPSPVEPTGPYDVGTVTYHLVDSSRSEIHSDDPEARRELMVQVWYPTASKPQGRLAPAIADADKFVPDMAKYLNFPPLFLSHVPLVRGTAFEGAAITNTPEKLPVVIFSHGWRGFREQNIFQAEELASHGYVVIAPSHTYGAMSVVFRDGRVISLLPSALDGKEGEDRQVARNRLIEQWSGDLSFVLDEMEKRDQDDPDGLFTGRLLLDRVGAMGHSTGGGAIVAFCARDPRCATLLGMDFWLEPVPAEWVSDGTDLPLLALHSQVWYDERDEGDNYALIQDYFRASGETQSQFVVMGTLHQDFSVLPMFSPLSTLLGLKGEIKGVRSLQIANAAALTFFDQALRGLPAPETLLQDIYPEMVPVFP